MVNVTLFLASTVILYRLARRSYGPEAAFIGLVILLFLPTIFSWSVSALKESLYVFLITAALAATVAVLRADGLLRRAGALLVLGAAIAANNTVRTGALVVEVAGLSTGLVAGLIVRRTAFVALTLALLPVAGVWMMRRASVQDRVLEGVKAAAALHIGNVRAEGHSYKLLDQRFYSVSLQDSVIPSMTGTEAARFTVRAVVDFVFLPLPWQVRSRSELVFLPQQVAWYLLVLMAAVGCVVGLRSDPLLTCLLTGLIVAGSGVIALNSGNIGTMIRFRDTVVPFVVWLSGLGIVGLVARFSEQTNASLPLPMNRGQRAVD